MPPEPPALDWQQTPFMTREWSPQRPARQTRDSNQAGSEDRGSRCQQGVDRRVRSSRLGRQLSADLADRPGCAYQSNCCDGPQPQTSSDRAGEIADTELGRLQGAQHAGDDWLGPRFFFRVLFPSERSGEWDPNWTRRGFKGHVACRTIKTAVQRGCGRSVGSRCFEPADEPQDRQRHRCQLPRTTFIKVGSWFGPNW